MSTLGFDPSVELGQGAKSGRQTLSKLREVGRLGGGNLRFLVSVILASLVLSSRSDQSEQLFRKSHSIVKKAEMARETSQLCWFHFIVCDTITLSHQLVSDGDCPPPRLGLNISVALTSNIQPATHNTLHRSVLSPIIHTPAMHCSCILGHFSFPHTDNITLSV